MNDPNRMLKWLLVIGLVVVSLWALYPPERKLKGGIDLVGGTSLLFEIDTTGLQQFELRDLSARVMRILRERVDPKGQLNLEWRPVGSTRLEVRMPRPPKVATERREDFNDAMAKIGALNLTRFEVESALNLPEAERAGAMQALERGVSARHAMLEALSTAYAAKVAASASNDPAGKESTAANYEKAMAELLSTSIPIGRLQDVLAAPRGGKRSEELDRLRAEFSAYDTGSANDPNGKLITKAAGAYDAWSANKGTLEDPSDLKRLLRGAGVLEFRILADRDPSSPANTSDPNPQLKQPISRYAEQLQKFGPRVKAGDRFQWFPVGDILDMMNVKNLGELDKVKSQPGRPIVEEYAGRYYVLMHSDPEYAMLRAGSQKWALVEAHPDRNQLTGQNVVSFTLDPRGGQQFRRLTGTHVGRQLAIMLDNTAMSAARIDEEIGERCQIRGSFSVEEVQDLVRVLDAGSLPARLKETPLAEKTIGPSLGETNRANGIRAALVGAVLVVLFVLFYYGFIGGGMADIALALNLLFTLAIMATMQATFTLPGIAGLVLAVGMAIDANVLIFERIREERARGVVFRKALNAGYDKAFSAIFDGNLTTLITCVILGYVGSEEVKGFAVTLGIGIATSMFTALTVTRLVFNTLTAKGLLNDFRMQKLIGIPNIDWIALRATFWPISTVLVVAGIGTFLWMSAQRTTLLYDIEFLGGTSVQLDLKPGSKMSDEDVRDAITGKQPNSASQWLASAADQLLAATPSEGDTPGRLVLTSPSLTGEQMAALLRSAMDTKVERGGTNATERAVTFDGRAGALTLGDFKTAIAQAAEQVRGASARLGSARVQSVGAVEKSTNLGTSFEVATTETNRDIVQTAIVSALADRLQIQRAINFAAERDENLTKEPYFVVEADDHYLSDVVGGDANFDIRRFRGGTAVKVQIKDTDPPLVPAEFERRLREVALQPEFEQYRTRESVVFPLDKPTATSDGTQGNREFAVCVVDETLMYDEDPVMWGESLAKPTLAQVTAALAREKSLSQVIQFAPQVAGQTKNRAVFAAVLAMLAIGAYVWFRFGTRDYGLAVLVCLVHDVAIVLGAVAISHLVHNWFLGKALLVDNFRVDLTMVAAVLTIIGYSLNDTIVVFDRIRENRGKMGQLSASLINSSISQTMSRTVLTSLTVFITVLVMYVMGGDGIHGFAYAMLVGTISGTYSTVFIAVPLVYRSHILRTIAAVIAGLLTVGAMLLLTTNAPATVRWVLSAAAVVVFGVIAARVSRSGDVRIGGQAAGA